MLRARDTKKSSCMIEWTSCEVCSGLLSVSALILSPESQEPVDSCIPCVPCSTSFICASSRASSSST